MKLTNETVLLNQSVATKEEAIRLAGELLVKAGFVSPEYVDAMLEREKIVSTYMGNFLAIPHGTDEAKKHILNSGISLVQVPAGVEFGNGDKPAKVIIGIAGKGDDHLEVLSTVAIAFSEIEVAEQIINASNVDEINAVLEGVEL
ncbi:PTS sugar transporter subunit IIA [Globicatella sanguinis]|uniref:PTS sugar transporter subunit IIA n=1 Tax=Globicatella sanguinis TaxID=13076 RepID=UPI0008259B61|nr:PTS sugar transporter subunit IIA [Globicatella sanguinis]